MTKTTNENKPLLRFILALIVIGVIIFLSDVFYDTRSGDKALIKCGEGNVKSVSTVGLFKTEIFCLALSK